MKLAATLDMARQSRLYPALILHGADEAARQAAAIELAKCVLCTADAPHRPCGACSNCRRLQWPDDPAGQFHPDLHLLDQDLRTVTSVEAAKEWLRATQFAPFEARGQVFVVARAETLSGEAANALLKTLEEPSEASPRNFLLLAPSDLDLLPTLRSRSLSVYLGASVRLETAEVEPIAAQLEEVLVDFRVTGNRILLLAAAKQLESAGDWDDPRDPRPWSLAAAAVTCCARGESGAPGERRALLALAEDLLGGGSLRARGIPARRILDGMVFRHLGR